VDSTSLATPTDPVHVGVADLNGDGIDDMVVGSQATGVVSVFLGEGGIHFRLHAEFVPASIARGLLSLNIADFTGDSRPDLAITTNYHVWLVPGFGDGTFGTAVPYNAGITAYFSHAGDLNGDGVADLVVANTESSTISVFLADGAGGFLPRVIYPAGPGPYDLDIVDLDSDGVLDVALANVVGFVSVFHGNGDGSFAAAQQYPSAHEPVNLAVGDLNGDHLPDIVTTSFDGFSGAVLLGVQGGLFETAPGFSTGSTGEAFAIRDFNADGRADLAMAMNFQGGIRIFPGDGAGGFAAGIDAPPGTGGMRGVATDLNGDAATDLVIPNRGESKITLLLSSSEVDTPLEARAFLLKQGPIQIGGGGPPFTCASVEPLAGAYENTTVNLSSFVMTSAGTGDVGLIQAEHAEISRDTDRNGVPEIQVCFSREDLKRLFSRISGRNVVTVGIEGALNTGATLRAALELSLKSPEAHAARVHPNPSNPSATLTFETERAGAVRVRLFDLSGRLVRTFLDDPRLGAGVHSTLIDGFDDEGNPIPSGVFFYQVESPERVEGGRITILK
jgi:hypothetical protein